MKSLLRRLILYTLTLAVTGCVAPHVLVERAVIQNDTPNNITDVVVRHEPTGKTARINMILSYRSFDLGFSSKPMRGRRGIITWKEENGLIRREELDLPYNRVFELERKSMILVYIIHSTGNVTVHLKEQDTDQ